MAHILLVATLRNPAVRRRYVAVREALAEYGLAEHGHQDVYEQLLACCAAVGCRRLRWRDTCPGWPPCSMQRPPSLPPEIVID